jgi:colanic acid/amylovoran biosynthesis glycosyltransferase
VSKTEPMRVAYLVSRYPGISHIFIEREVLGLRALGLDVETFSVRPCPPDQLRTDTMRAEAARTTSILDGSPTRLSMLLLKVAVRHWMPVLRAARITAMLGEQVLRSRVWQMFYLAEAMALMEHCRARGIKHIHVHFANNGADIARLAVILGEHIEGKDAGWRWSFTMHGSNEFEAVDRFDLAAKVRSASGVVCVSDFTRSQLMRLVDSEHWAKLTKVHMTVDEDVYQPPADRRRDRTGPFRILMVGRLVPEKAPLILVEAVDQLVRRGVCVDLRFVGSGMLEDRLKADVKERGLDQHVTWLGALGQHQIPAWYHWADVFCLPSFQEGLPVVLMEAMATELPVVTTRIAAISELVQDGISGEVVSAGRADLIADALARLASDPQRRLEQGRRGRQMVLREFTTDRAADEMCQFFERLTARG